MQNFLIGVLCTGYICQEAQGRKCPYKARTNLPLDNFARTHTSRRLVTILAPEQISSGPHLPKYDFVTEAPSPATLNRLGKAVEVLCLWFTTDCGTDKALGGAYCPFSRRYQRNRYLPGYFVRLVKESIW